MSEVPFMFVTCWNGPHGDSSCQWLEEVQQLWMKRARVAKMNWLICDAKHVIFYKSSSPTNLKHHASIVRKIACGIACGEVVKAQIADMQASLNVIHCLQLHSRIYRQELCTYPWPYASLTGGPLPSPLSRDVVTSSARVYYWKEHGECEGF